MNIHSCSPFSLSISVLFFPFLVSSSSSSSSSPFFNPLLFHFSPTSSSLFFFHPLFLPSTVSLFSFPLLFPSSSSLFFFSLFLPSSILSIRVQLPCIKNIVHSFFLSLLLYLPLYPQGINNCIPVHKYNPFLEINFDYSPPSAPSPSTAELSPPPLRNGQPAKKSSV